MSRIERGLLRWLQRRCAHPGNEVSADILQHDNLPTAVYWCRTCGAYAVYAYSNSGPLPEPTFRRPEPTWNR